jgi:CubicO group peptidase (beta-lactamase class C family)
MFSKIGVKMNKILPLSLIIIFISSLLPIPARAAPSVIDPAAMEQWIDGQMQQAIDQKHIPGGIVVVTQGQDVLFMKAYGQANIEGDIPYDINKTIIGLGSTGKIATALGVMSEVEAGRLDLNASVKDYLAAYESPVEINSPFAEPVRLNQLLTHTAGFDENMTGMAASTPEKLRTLEDFLSRRLPPVVIEPGKYWAYSNMGVALAGYLAQLSSGQDLADLVDQHFFQPLGMERTTMHQPSRFAEDAVTGYNAVNGKFQAMPPFYINDWPAGGLTTTAADWSRLMIALANEGNYQGTQILKPETVADMMSPHYTGQPYATNQMGWVFWLEEHAGQRVAHHGGFGGGQSTEMLILPDSQAAILVQTNSTDTQVRDTLPWTIAQRYFYDPQAKSDPVPFKMRQDPESFGRLDLDGWYRYQRYPHTTWMRFGTLSGDFSADRYFELLPNGAIQNENDVYVPQGDGLYATPGGKKTLMLEQDAQNRVVAIFDDFGNAMLRVPWRDSLAFLKPLALICLGLLVSAIYWSFEKPLRRLFHQPPLDERRGPQRARLVATILSFLPLVAFVLYILFVSTRRTDVFAVDGSLQNTVMVLVGWAVALFAVVTGMMAVQSWLGRWWGIPNRLHYSLVALGGLGLTWFLWVMNFFTLRNF